MKTKLLTTVLIVCYVLNFTAQTQKELANKYLNQRGELSFSFTVDNLNQINELSRIISFDHGQDRNNPLKIKAIANKKSFKKFLEYNLSFEVDVEANEPKDVVMFNPKIHKKNVSGKNATYTLSFPLTAYPTYAQYVSQMNDFVNNHSDIARLVNIGTTPGSAAGSHDILCLVLSDNVNIDEVEPRMLYTSSIHGDELAGYPSMLNLIDHLITAYYDSENPDYGSAQALINGAELWINPLANPDGTYRTTNDNVGSAIRGNANVVDMNRNYPAPDGTLHPDGEVYQSETLDFIKLAEDYHFVLAANFHGGEEVFNYPWDFTYDRTVDDNWWRLVGEEYALNAQNDSPNGYSDPNDNGANDSGEYFDFLKATAYEPNPILGVIHGADWYRIDGGRQDFMNFEHQCREVTIELSQTKTSPSPASGSLNYDILDMWNYNKKAYIDFLLQGTYGFRGIVEDANTNLPVKAKITIVGRDDQALSRNSWVETDIAHGDFYRLIEAGTYDILIEADCYQSETLTNQVVVNGVATNLATISLAPLSASAPTNPTEAIVTSTSATLNWDDMGVTSYDVRYRVNGSSDTWIETNVTTNTLDVSSLSPLTTYEFQVRSICTAASEYTTLEVFSTLAVNYCSSIGTNVSQEYISNVQFESINNVSTGAGYSDFTGLSTDVSLNQTYPFSVSKYGNKGNVLAIWIDFNKNGDFTDSGELVHSSSNLTGNISIPNTSDTGLTRMRISLKRSIAALSCETFTRGEVEDYTVNIIDGTLGFEDEVLNQFIIYPNPSNKSKVNIKLPDSVRDFEVTMSSILGKQVYFEKVYTVDRIHTIEAESLNTGIYFVTIQTEFGKATKKIIIQ